MIISSLLRFGRVVCNGVEYGWNARSRPDFSDSLMPALLGAYMIHALIHLEILESSPNQVVRAVHIIVERVHIYHHITCCDFVSTCA